MKNRAKCKLCDSIIESFHRYDVVSCQCGEISIDGGFDFYRAVVGDWNNFLRIDDEGNEIIPKIEENKEDIKKVVQDYARSELDAIQKKKDLCFQDLLQMLDEITKSYQNLPPHARYEPVSNSDLEGLLMLLSKLFKSL